MRSFLIQFVLFIALTHILISIKVAENENNFQSLYDLLNPSKFLENYENWFLDKGVTKPETLQNNTEYLEYSTFYPPLMVSRPNPYPNPDSPGGQIQSIKGPQSLTIFMNFQNDGTTSLQILNENNLNWFDLGNCRHGQIFHSPTQLCVDLFCIEGYVLTPKGNFLKLK